MSQGMRNLVERVKAAGMNVVCACMATDTGHILKDAEESREEYEQKRKEIRQKLLGSSLGNPIGPLGIFNTPDDMDALMANLEQYSGGEKQAAMVAMGLTWNLAHKVVEDMLTNYLKSEIKS